MLRDSRYQYCLEMFDAAGVPYITEPEPFVFRVERDNVVHTVVEGDTLWNLAHRYFAGHRRPKGLWWLIGQFQPTPIVDPTLALVPGTKLIIPSARLLRLAVFSPARRRDH